ncbi:MAG: hypothetical protein JO186_10140 [Actinobacteria bacterium]|nr:hypothetical protein [Actinomycetota bacterium]MBV8395692.1 hypothetical protein [Actinomycetota bacterium]MBV8597656.1 hypothetical protein [Actinomycetota bacterium]
MAETTTPGELIEEAHHGHSERTPAIALTGVFVAVSIVVAVVAGVALLVYYVA